MCVDLLLDACRLTREDPQLTEETLGDLTGAVHLTRQVCEDDDTGLLAHAVTLLTAALGRIPRFNPTHLPFGFRGPYVQSRQWVDLKRIDLINTQMVGLYLPEWEIERVRYAAQSAIAEATSLGLLERKVYDAWLPGMASGSGWTTAICATPLGVVRARQAAQALAALETIPQSPVAPTASVPSSPPATSAPTREPAMPEGPAVILGDPGTTCRVLGQEKRPLTDGQHAVVAALREAGSEGMSKDSLELVRPSARRILRDLCRDDHWARVILLPGQTNGRYRIKS